MKFAFSTSACPEWTIERAAQAAEDCGYLGIEMRTDGRGSREIACDPALTVTGKVRSLLAGAGAELCSLATGVRFDAPVTPPIIGYAISDVNRSAREGKAMVELAAALGAPMIRVFAFSCESNETRNAAMDRIVGRLVQVADAGRARNVRVLVQNGGSFETAAHLAELLDAAGHPSLGACYDAAVAHHAGESVWNGVNVLADRLGMVKLRDFKNGKACALGEGVMPCHDTITVLARAGYPGWVCAEYDRVWVGGEGDVGAVLKRSAEALYRWAGSAAGRRAALAN